MRGHPVPQLEYFTNIMVVNTLMTVLNILALVVKLEAFKFPDNKDVNFIDRSLDHTANEDSEHLKIEIEKLNITAREAKHIRGISSHISE